MHVRKFSAEAHSYEFGISLSESGHVSLNIFSTQNCKQMLSDDEFRYNQRISLILCNKLEANYMLHCQKVNLSVVACHTTHNIKSEASTLETCFGKITACMRIRRCVRMFNITF